MVGLTKDDISTAMKAGTICTIGPGMSMFTVMVAFMNLIGAPYAWLRLSDVYKRQILGNVIVLIPIQLNSHVGTKYGIPYPIFARMTFGNKGAKLSTISRSIIGCGWTSIQSWVGGGALAALIGIVIPFFSDQSQTISMPGNDNVMVGQLIGFAVFVLVCGWVAYNGMEKIKWVQNISAPLLIVVITGLIIWSIYTIYATGHSFMDVFRVGNNEALIEQNGGFAYVYLAGLTANIAYWATMALNIPDFSKMAKSQKDQFNGQLIGMPIPMACLLYTSRCV